MEKLRLRPARLLKSVRHELPATPKLAGAGAFSSVLLGGVPCDQLARGRAAPAWPGACARGAMTEHEIART